MSTSSKPRSRPPAHQNKTAFRHNKNSKLSKKIAESTTTHGLCDRCTSKQEWRVKYRKYKPLTAPKKCNKCGQRTIKAAYRTLCDKCAGVARVCAGCGQGKELNTTETPPSAAEMQQEQSAIIEVLNNLTERQRRTVLRRVEGGEDEIEVLTELMGGELELDNSSEEEDEVEENIDNSDNDSEDKA